MTQTVAPARIPAPSGPAAIALIAVLLYVFFLKQVADFDLWFHLAVGRQTLLTGQIPQHGFNVIPLLGEAERFYEWGFGVLLHLLHSAGGIAALCHFNAALGALTLSLLAIAGLRTPPGWRDLAATAAACLAIAATIDFRLVLRPEIVLFAAMAATICTLEAFLRSADRRVLVALPLLSATLANLHPSAIFLLALAGCHAVHLWLQNRRGDARALAVAAAAMAAAACLNPHGIHQLILPFLFALDTQLMARVVEFETVIHSPALPAYLVLLAATLPALFLRETRRTVDLLLVALFAVAAFRYARNLGLLAIVCYLPLRALFGALLARSEQRLQPSAVRALGAVLIGAGVLLLASQRMDAGNWGSGVRPGVFPAPIEIAGDRRTAGVASLFQYGGYLNWATGKPVLADGRNYTFNAALAAHDTVFSGKPGWDALLDRYRVDVIFTPAIQPAGGRPVPLLANLFQSAEWQLTAADDVGLWFVRSALVAPAQWLDKGLIWQRIVADERKRGTPGPPDDPLLRHAHRMAGLTRRRRSWKIRPPFGSTKRNTV